MNFRATRPCYKYRLAFCNGLRFGYNSLINDLGLKPNSMEIIHTLLHPTFRLAVRDNYIRVNPTSEVMSEIKKEHNWEKPKRIALTIDEQSAFISFMSNSPTYKRWLPIMTVFLGTGCRVGEIIVLRWEYCDFENMTISINHNMIYRKYKGETESRFHVTTPKTKAGLRTIPMLSDVKQALELEYEFQQIFGINETVVDGYSGFIFQNVRQLKHDLTGQKFGFLRVIEPIVNPYVKGNETRWKCRCENCGRIVQVSSYWLRHSDPYGHCKCTRFSKPQSK